MTHTEVSTPSSATSTVNAWLHEFDEALQARDIQRVLTLFNDECYWRDFLAFTWNLKTCEGQKEIQAMLDATLANSDLVRKAIPSRRGLPSKRPLPAAKATCG